jgi:hypothetical protein
MGMQFRQTVDESDRTQFLETWKVMRFGFTKRKVSFIIRAGGTLHHICG